MSANVKKFLDFEDFYELNVTYTLVNGIWLNPLEFMASHNGTSLGLQTLSIQGTEYVEVAFADLDLALSAGKYTVDPTTNSIILIVDKITVDDDEKAKNLIQGILVTYQAETIEYFSSDSLYTLETHSADGTFIGSTSASSTGTLVSRMYVLDANLDVNSESGYYIHTYRRALQATV